MPSQLELFLEPSRTSALELFANTNNVLKLLTIFAMFDVCRCLKIAIADVWQGSKYFSAQQFAVAGRKFEGKLRSRKGILESPYYLILLINTKNKNMTNFKLRLSRRFCQ